MIDRKRSRELRAELDAEEIALDSLMEIEDAYASLPWRERPDDLPESGSHEAMLDALDVARRLRALDRLHAARSDASCARAIANRTLRLVAYLAAQTEWDSDTLAVLGEHVAAVTKRAGLPAAVDNDDDAQAFWLDVCDALGIEYPEDEED